MRLLVVGRREFWALLSAARLLVHRIMETLSNRVREAEASVSV
jgi:CRP-like cAMP-binding protein